MDWTFDKTGDQFTTSRTGRRYKYHPLSGLYVEVRPNVWNRVPHPNRWHPEIDIETFEAHEAHA